MIRPPHFDVIVVGARCAGAATAMLLARQGLRTLLLERAQHGRDTVSTLALMRGGVRQLARWGLLDSVRDAGTPALAGSTFDYGEVTEAVDARDGALYAPRRTVLDPLLVDAAARAGAEVRHGTGVTDVARRGDGRVVGVTGPGGTVLATARLTVGADGLRSRVAAAVGARAYRRGHASGAFAYRYWAGLPAAARYHWYYRPGVTAGRIPTNGGLTCVWVGVPTAGFGALRRPDLATGYHRTLGGGVPELADALHDATPVGPVHGFRGTPGHLRVPWGPGWALVGDAGYFKDPITAHGITDALRDAELLARAAAEAHRTGDERTAFAGYQRKRDELSGALFTVTDRIASYEWDTARLRDLLLALSKAQRAENETLAALDAVPWAA
jgi:flavin-dependent dehydrogenase